MIEKTLACGSDSAEFLPWCCLTEEDVRLLEKAAAIHGGEDSPTGRAVVEKIRGSVVELRDEIPPGYVTLGSRITFSVNDGPSLSRVLVHWDKWPVPGLDLSLATPWGITLLGMRVGSEAAAYWRNGTAERIKVLAAEPPLRGVKDVVSVAGKARPAIVAAEPRRAIPPMPARRMRKAPGDGHPLPPAA
jgi:hypothetical protein